MTRIKVLLLVAVMTAVLLLSGCEFISGLGQEHVHYFKYMPTENGGHRKECECGALKDEHAYIHKYVWANIESFETAYRECTECGYKEYQRDLHTEPLTVVSAVSGDPGDASLVFFEAKVEAGSFDYNEEFDINMKVTLETAYIEDGPFQIKLEESPYYEIIGDAEYTVTDLVPQEHRQYVMDLTFRVKAIKPCNITQAFDFKIKFNPTKSFLYYVSYYPEDSIWYYSPSEEYFFGFKQLTFINDSKGMLLGDAHEYGDKLFYDSINREYLSGVIDKNAYVNRLVTYLTEDSVLIVQEGADTICYRSKNIRAKITLGDEYKHLFDKSQGSFNERRPLIASTILDILLQKGYITDEEYQNEKVYISERGYCESLEYVLYEKVPIADYVRENYYQFVYEDNSTSEQSNESGILDGNSAVLHLSDDMIEVGGEVDVSIYTEFSDSIESYTIEIQDGFSLSSEIIFINNEIHFSVTHNGQKSNPHFEMEIILSNEEETTFYADLYGYVVGETLYLSQWSENEAYNVFLAYERIAQGKNLTYDEIEDILVELQSKETLPRTISLDEEVHDTFISGEFYWQEANEPKRNFPLQYTLILFYDRGAVNETFLGACYTDDEGKYSFSLTNDTSPTENGYDIVVKIVAAGEDVFVCHDFVNSDNYEIYYEEYHLADNIISGTYDNISYTYGMGSPEDPNMFGHAFQISQAGIMASKYYETMSNKDVPTVPIIYPHTNTNNDGCYFTTNDGENGSINIIGNMKNSVNLYSYASWDVLMHEYGHFVGYMEEISDSPGGNHYISSAMAEHYMSHFKNTEPTDKKMECVLHFNPTRFGENDCKEQGTKLAWSEGLATYFSMAAQEYAQEHFGLGAVDTVGDGVYSAYNLTNPILIEGCHNQNNWPDGTEDTERTIQGLLYDLYDSYNSTTDNDFDSISLGHEVLWDLIMNSKAKTFDEFDDYFHAHPTSAEDMQHYGKLLAYHNLAPYDVSAIGGLTTYCPTFTWTWVEDNNVTNFDDRSFKLNFYNSEKTLIGSTTEQIAVSSITIDETLWQTILDSGEKFYVSVTITENHTPVTEYEGWWREFNIPVQTAALDSGYSEVLYEGDCYWYKFTAPETADYIFATTGTVDTVADILEKPVVGRSTTGIQDVCDDGGESENFSFTKLMTAGETIYVRVRGVEWMDIGVFTFRVTQVAHTHVYTHHYGLYNTLKHKAYCACGSYTLESHSWQAGVFENTCKKCFAISTGLVTKDEAPVIGDDYALLYKQDEEYCE